MAAAANRGDSTQQKLAAAFRKNPRQAGVLAVLVAVLGGLWWRMATGGQAGPAAAVAAAGAQAVAQPAADKLRAGSSKSHGGGDVEGLAEWLKAPAAPLSRNLFAVALDRYPQDPSAAAAATANPAAVAAPGFWDDLTKSVGRKADERRERQARLEAVRQAASGLTVTSTVMGAKPRAVVNGDLVGEGDVVASGAAANRTVFRVLKIEPRRLIVEHEGIRLAVPMN